MKLIRKINSQFLFVSLGMLIFVGVSLAIVLHRVIDDQIEDKMEYTYQNIKKKLNNNSPVNTLTPFVEIHIIPPAPDTLFLSESTVFNTIEEENEPFKQLNATTTIHHNTYRIVIRESKLETDDFFESIISIVLLAILLMIVALYFTNRKISQSVLSVFYHNLDKVKAFSLQKGQALNLSTSDITEFNELNTVLVSLTNKVISDYHTLKQFSEDAAHELQTPLAIIRTKLEALLNASDIPSSHLEKIQSVYATTHRLTRLNKDLLLLSKIENNQFEPKEVISLVPFIEKKVEEWHEMIALHQITLSTRLETPLTVKMHPNLAEILVSNVLSNAIRHNLPQGQITISINGNTLSISNSGEHPIENPDAIFNRFHKENPSQKSIGLGLAIVKKISETHQIQVNYSFEERRHIFTFQFPL